MATLQKIRAKGPLLVIVIGLALFAFIAEEAMRSIQSASNESKQQVGEIYGERISVQIPKLSGRICGSCEVHQWQQRTQRPTTHSITRPSLEHIRQQQTHRARS